MTDDVSFMKNEILTHVFLNRIPGTFCLEVKIITHPNVLQHNNFALRIYAAVFHTLHLSCTLYN